MRRPLLAGNWKMNLGHDEALALAKGLAEAVGTPKDRDVALFPTFVSVAGLAAALAKSPIAVGGQDCAAEDDGAFTGEVSAPILRSTGATMVLVGHSERRQLFGDTDERVQAKLAKAFAADLVPVLCVGETQAEREAGDTLKVVRRQLDTALQGLGDAEAQRLVVAYEPVWAIGTGLVATPEQAQEVHAAVRAALTERFGATGTACRVLYGGSVKPDNVDGLMAQPDIDGALVGGASLKLEDFARIVGFQPA